MTNSWTRGYLVGLDDQTIWRNHCGGNDCRTMNCWLVRFDLRVSIKILDLKDEPVVHFVPFDSPSEKKGLIVSEKDREFYASLMKGANKNVPKRFNIAYCYDDQC